MNQQEIDVARAEIVNQDAIARAATGSPKALRARLLSGSMIMLVSSGFVGATNLLYNIIIARQLGATEFGHATAIYTLLMLLSSVTLSFQLVCSKFVARNEDLAAKVAVYKTLHRRSWQIAISIGLATAFASSALSHYLNLPTWHYILVLSIGIALYIPLGVRRGLMQGLYDFKRLALNFALEVTVKLIGAILLLHYGFGVMGVIAAVALSIAIAYLAGAPAAALRMTPASGQEVSFYEGMQAIVFFVGQVTINNLDIILVKHFFPSALAGLYAAVALVGRVVYMLSWSVVSSMFPVLVGSAHERGGKTVMSTALLLVVMVSSLFTAAVWLAPSSLWTSILGPGFLVQAQSSFSSLLVMYAALTGIYSFSVVLMTYEMSRRIGNAGWMQLAFSIAIAVGIYRYHSTLHQVITVQLVLMILLLIAVAIPFLKVQPSPLSELSAELAGRERLLQVRRTTEDEVIADFLKAEFFQPEFDPYRERFSKLVFQPDLGNDRECRIRRALLFRRRGRLWRELPLDTEWWEVALQPSDLAQLRIFPRKQWRGLASGSFYLLDMISRIKQRVFSESEITSFSAKMKSVTSDVASGVHMNSIILIGIDASGPFTILEGNHRMAGAMLVSPETAHQRFNFFCGLSPRMSQCCWYQTDFNTLSRYAKNIVRYMFRDRDYFIERTLRDATLSSGVVGSSTVSDSDLTV